MDNNVKPAHLRQAEQLVAETHASGGLAPVDLDRFYADQEIAAKAPFGHAIPQCPLGIWMSGECVYAELGIEEDYWRYGHDEEWRLDLNRRYNDKSERIVGKRLLGEQPGPPAELRYPPTKGLADLFEGKTSWHSGSWWLEQAADSPDELAALLERVETRLDDLAGFILPADWETEWTRLRAAGINPPAYRHQRGPITFAASIYGPENLIFLILDQPELADRFRDCIVRGMLGIAETLDQAAGRTRETEPRGFSFADDNCCLLSPEMYERFGWPVLKTMFDRYASEPHEHRYQHSDSAMSHLLPLLGKLGMTGLNLGPSVRVDEIRRHCPKAVIHGQLAPFTFSRNEEVNIVAEFLRDFEQAQGERGLLFSTAGSINNGSRLTGLRLIMAAIQRYGRY